MRIAAGILLLCCTNLACACSVVRISCNFPDDNSPVVFVGTVVSPEDPETQVLLHGSPVVFNVTERIRGNVGKQISIYESRRVSCDFGFELGKSYLVFAYFENGRLTTSELTSTRPTWAAGALVRQLRTLSQGHGPASLFGYLGEGGRLANDLWLELLSMPPQNIAHSAAEVARMGPLNSTTCLPANI